MNIKERAKTSARALNSLNENEEKETPSQEPLIAALNN